MTNQQRRDEAYAVWRDLDSAQKQIWQIGVGNAKVTPRKLKRLGEDLQRLGQRLIDAAKRK